MYRCVLEVCGSFRLRKSRNFFERFFGCEANWANPSFRQLFESCSGLNLVLRVSFQRIINVVANRAFPLRQVSAANHGKRIFSYGLVLIMYKLPIETPKFSHHFFLFFSSKILHRWIEELSVLLLYMFWIKLDEFL